MELKVLNILLMRVRDTPIRTILLKFLGPHFVDVQSGS